MEMENKKNPPPDRSIIKEPEREPNTFPSPGQHRPDIQDEKSKRKHGSISRKKDDINHEKIPNGNPEEYNDGAPVEEKSPRISNSL